MSREAWEIIEPHYFYTRGFFLELILVDKSLTA
ncbi:uncharacterized protein RCO7_15270 [Rhynchosporium graminicola]|uniref:Uncharacterized protein n=2 Tax=Rhynchosporium TaxID=38037 RepID=A0A1E1MWL0_RHYSE|nr:uncharacterized protein RCO7_15270 [Rhynchosporium commune]CZT53462.1 uncharacterized protein RSE6_15047 [Rhynchosporium secalis]